MGRIWTWLQRLINASPGVDQRKHQPAATADRSLKSIHSQQELAREIRTLIAGGHEPSDQKLFALQDRFSRNLASELPDFIGHWLADADIRQRDAEHNKAQASQLEEALRQMESPPRH